MQELAINSDARKSVTALKVQCGLMRFLRQQYNFNCFAEVTLANSRRCDALAIGPRGNCGLLK